MSLPYTHEAQLFHAERQEWITVKKFRIERAAINWHKRLPMVDRKRYRLIPIEAK